MSNLPNLCRQWTEGNSDSLLNGQEQCLIEFANAGCTPFVGPAHLIGANAGVRDALIIHRGRGKRWEIVFDEECEKKGACFTTDLLATKDAAIKWLHGESIDEVKNFLRPVVVETP